jgi:hypothetical protein
MGNAAWTVKESLAAGELPSFSAPAFASEEELGARARIFDKLRANGKLAADSVH